MTVFRRILEKFKRLFKRNKCPGKLILVDSDQDIVACGKNDTPVGVLGKTWVGEDGYRYGWVQRSGFSEIIKEG